MIRNIKSTNTMILNFLQNNGPATLTEVVDGLSKTGWVTESKAPRAYVSGLICGLRKRGLISGTRNKYEAAVPHSVEMTQPEGYDATTV